MLRDDSVLTKALSTVIREQGDHFLLFNSVSDQMYLITRDALCIFKLCNGILAIRQIQDLVALRNKNFNTDAGRDTLRRFLKDMVDRGLLAERLDP